VAGGASSLRPPALRSASTLRPPRSGSGAPWRRSLAPSAVRSAAARPAAHSSIPQPVSRVRGARLLSADLDR